MTGRVRMATLLANSVAVGTYVLIWGSAACLAFTAYWLTFVAPEPILGVPPWGVAWWAFFTSAFLVLAQSLEGVRRRGGRPLPRVEAPGLYALLEEVSAAVGVTTVRHVRVKPAPVLGVARAFVPQKFFVRERRVLVIGLPILRALSVEELRSALCHEFAHFAGGDVRRAAVVNAAGRRLAIMLGVLRRGGAFLTWLNPLWWVLTLYRRLLNRAASAVRRLQESRADALAARVSGVGVYAATLVRLAALDLSFRRFAPGVLVRARREGRTVDNFYRELHETLEAMAPPQRRRVVRDVLAEDGGDGAHPPLRERLAALGVTRPPRRERGADPASELVADLDALECELTPLAVRGVLLGFRKQLKRRAAFAAKQEGGPGDSTG